ncbi:MAG: hypothetical protein ACJ8OJ_13045, partial [Povalibacter sp.]
GAHRLAPQVLFRKRREYFPVGSLKNIHVFERCEKNFRRKSVGQWRIRGPCLLKFDFEIGSSGM